MSVEKNVRRFAASYLRAAASVVSGVSVVGADKVLLLRAPAGWTIIAKVVST